MKPLILALDTTHEYGGIALLRGGDLVDEVTLHAPTGFAHVVYGHLDALLRRNALALANIDCFAAAAGPGSFTGVRVGLACIKGLAEAEGKPAAGVSNLQALATFGAAPLRAPVIDARRGEIYGAVYDSGGRLVMPEVVAPLEAWRNTIPAEAEIVEMQSDRPLARAVAAIALARLMRGEPADPAALDANYVRRADAELFWKE